jgi:cytochrome b6-f complex iron-sulfur subunit
MSVAEMMAAARAEKSGGKPAESGGGTTSSEQGSESAKPAEPAKKPGQMSVAEMLAAARGEKSKPAAPSPQKAPPAAAPTKAAPAAKGKKGEPAPKAPSGPKDTASILAAARKESKPGPMSKAEAAAQGKPLPPSGKTAAEPVMPQRPAYLEKPAPPAATSRRTFFGAFSAVLFGSSLAVGFSSLFVTQLLWLLGLARFMFPNVLIEPPTVFKVGFADDYAPGQVETKYVAQFGVWIVRDEYDGQAQIFALQTVCTHLGCTPNWLEGEQKFKCPCHGSGFYKDGINFEGPAPRPLERYAIQVADDGQLEVDKSRTFQEEMGQWRDTSSFVPV